MQASWRGEKVNNGGLTVAPYWSSSLTHSRLPAAQASHNGVLPSMLRASTWRAKRDNKAVHQWRKKQLDLIILWSYESLHHLTCAPASRSSLTHWVCPWIHASCRGVMESTATMLTAAPPSISRCSWRVLPCAAASCTADRSVQKPRPWAANERHQSEPSHSDHRMFSIYFVVTMQVMQVKTQQWILSCNIMNCI